LTQYLHASKVRRSCYWRGLDGVDVYLFIADPEVEEASITDEGILGLCDALGIDAQDPVMLALSSAMGSESMGVYTRTEFRCGMHKLHCKSIEDLRGKIPALRDQMRDRAQFSSIYSVRTLLAAQAFEPRSHCRLALV
jgi:hypothetical protein